MDSSSMSGLMAQVFSRFLVSGIVFYLFVLWIPCYLFKEISSHHVLNNPGFVILASLGIGLALDLSKAYRASWLFFAGTIRRGEFKLGLEISINEAFSIKVDRLDRSKAYLKRVGRTAGLIHEVFLRMKQPALYKDIKDVRVYPDVLSMSFFSLLFLTVICIALLIRGFTFRYSDDFGPGTLLFVLFLAALVYTLIVGRKKLKYQYQRVRECTALAIRQGHTTADVSDRDRFLAGLEEQGLIERMAGSDEWRIAKG